MMHLRKFRAPDYSGVRDVAVVYARRSQACMLFPDLRVVSGLLRVVPGPAYCSRACVLFPNLRVVSELLCVISGPARRSQLQKFSEYIAALCRLLPALHLAENAKQRLRPGKPRYNPTVVFEIHLAAVHVR